MTIKQLGGVFGRNPTFNDVTIEGTLTFDGDIDITSDLTIEDNLYVLGSVGIGTTTPSTALHVNSGNTNNVATFESTDANAKLILKDNTSQSIITANAGNMLISADDANAVADSSMQFDVDGNEAMRIDSGRNLLIGKTASDIGASEGFEWYNSADVLTLTRDAGHALSVNRLNGSGDIIQLREDSSPVGSIGVSSSVPYFINTQSSGSGLRMGTGVIQPSDNAGAKSDATHDLGSSSGRFKDLWLSGGAYLGGTGAANLLDDYEEGTWTPVIADAASAGNTSPTSATSATYTKIGNLVTVQMNIQNIDTTGMTGANDIFIRGLPFAVKSISGASYFTGSLMAATLTFTGNVSVIAEDNTSHVYIAETTSAAAVDLVTVSEISTGATDLWFSLTYMAA